MTDLTASPTRARQVAVRRDHRSHSPPCSSPASQWGSLDGALVITALKGAKLLVLTLNPAGDVSRSQSRPSSTTSTAACAPPAPAPTALYLTTSNAPTTNSFE